MALVLLMDFTVFVVAHYPVEWRNSQVTRWMFWMHLSCIGVFVVLFLFKTWYIHCSLKPQRSVR
jgi:hypothetical protein